MPHCPACSVAVPADARQCKACGAPFLNPSYGTLESRLTPAQESALRMPRPVPVVLGVLGIGGAAWGLAAMVGAASSMARPSFPTLLLLGLSAALFVFAGYCGVRALQRAPGWLRLNQVLWAIQVPVVASPFVSYSFAAGGFLSAWLQLYPPLRVGWNIWLGSTYTISIGTQGPVVVGINLLALAIAWYLMRLQRSDA